MQIAQNAIALVAEKDTRAAAAKLIAAAMRYTIQVSQDKRKPMARAARKKLVDLDAELWTEHSAFISLSREELDLERQNDHAASPRKRHLAGAGDALLEREVSRCN